MLRRVSASPTMFDLAALMRRTPCTQVLRSPRLNSSVLMVAVLTVFSTCLICSDSGSICNFSPIDAPRHHTRATKWGCNTWARIRAPLLRVEFVRRGVPVILPWPQQRARKVRLVRRIGKMLRLETEAVTPAIHGAASANDAAIEEVARIELHAGLRGVDLHGAAAPGIAHARRTHQLAGLAV